VYCDFSYRVDGGEVTAEAPFGLFLRELAADCERLVVVGRLDPGPGRFPYVMTGVEFVPLPHYVSGAQFGAVMRTLPAGLRRFWRTLADVDVAWIFGPNPPQALAFALLAMARPTCSKPRFACLRGVPRSWSSDPISRGGTAARCRCTTHMCRYFATNTF
jgi:hypothetical protein